MGSDLRLRRQLDHLGELELLWQIYSGRRSLQTPEKQKNWRERHIRNRRTVQPCPSTGSCYRHNNQISVAIEPGASIIHARLRASLGGLDEGDFTEGHELDRKSGRQVPKAMIGRRLSQEEAKRLLAKLR